ncbi:putative transmembrane efflux protein [Streptomyces bingchenggensis BCW-1]|uniref:Putative transmembrane efflux protein n=1 Tax=Streptomyces bingchenggensis (strain BCW-1) TaxID=749414 RepID=D7BYC4_STRBB|nr:putative transmembrane efflux protein [Streptomyces bingchenggensis BCW-1]
MPSCRRPRSCPALTRTSPRPSSPTGSRSSSEPCQWPSRPRAVPRSGNGAGRRHSVRRHCDSHRLSVHTVSAGVASLLCGLAPNMGMLITARALQGVGGALLTPGSLALIEASFHPDDRARAVGLWSGFGGIGAAVGPFLGGWLVDGPGWRWIFLLNVPLALACVSIALRHVPESMAAPHQAAAVDSGTGAVPEDTARRQHGFDVSGAALGALALALATYALVEARNGSLVVALSAAGGVAAGFAFVFVERHRPDPMMPLSRGSTADRGGDAHDAPGRPRRVVCRRCSPCPAGHRRRHGQLRRSADGDPAGLGGQWKSRTRKRDQQRGRAGRRARRRCGAAAAHRHGLGRVSLGRGIQRVISPGDADMRGDSGGRGGVGLRHGARRGPGPSSASMPEAWVVDDAAPGATAQPPPAMSSASPL